MSSDPGPGLGSHRRLQSASTGIDTSTACDHLELVDGGEATYVPDGDPCPVHGLPTRLMTCGGGLMSQCQGCRDAFLDWFREHTRHIVVAIDPSPPVPAAPAPILKRRKPLQPQIGLAL